MAHTRLPRQGPHRLSRRDRRRLQRRRRRQRHRRHDDDDDVDRRRRAARRCSRPSSAPASRCSSSASRGVASSSATRRSRRTPTRDVAIDWPRVAHRRLHPDRRDRRQRRRSTRASTTVRRPFPVPRRRGLGGDPARPRRCARPTGRCCRARFKGSVFLLSLVLCASMMPVEHLPRRVVADRARPGLSLVGVRQHPADRAGAEAGRLRLGLPRLRRRLRRLDDLVRLVGRRRAVEHVSGGALGRPVAAPRLARRVGLRRSASS